MKARICFNTITLLFILAFSNASFAQVDLQNSDLPLIVIDTEGASILDEPQITAHMGVIDNGIGQGNNITGPFNNYDGFIGTEIL